MLLQCPMAFFVPEASVSIFFTLHVNLSMGFPLYDVCTLPSQLNAGSPGLGLLVVWSFTSLPSSQTRHSHAEPTATVHARAASQTAARRRMVVQTCATPDASFVGK